MAWKRPSSFREFLEATVEALDKLEKSLVGDPDPLFPELAVPEPDLTKVRGAFDMSVVDPDQAKIEPGADEETVARAELLQNALLDIRGDKASATAHVDVGRNGIPAGTLSIKPVKHAGDRFRLDVRYLGESSVEPVVPSWAKCSVQRLGS
ncbi:hypothetical protein GCM10010178_92390 [Lentzea flava]|uniref:Uncharacterized protein n=1 Tax=Lentzea flava TaxID=103732 RepID=A0ABQ2VM76_9PSEU|nr:hypothetical protein [Lentzea flava]GGU88811.1 hypothetical protein GCM10010178_92390 [Lentzea flava]